ASGLSPMNISKNVISGNVRDGMRISGFSNLISVSSNRIGTNAAGDRAVPNGANGIEGSAMVGPANVISGNRGNGILGGGTIFQNFIGVDASGNKPLGNGGHGIDSLQGVTIGITENTKP